LSKTYWFRKHHFLQQQLFHGFLIKYSANLILSSLLESDATTYRDMVKGLVPRLIL